MGLSKRVWETATRTDVVVSLCVFVSTTAAWTALINRLDWLSSQGWPAMIAVAVLASAVVMIAMSLAVLAVLAIRINRASATKPVLQPTETGVRINPFVAEGKQTFVELLIDAREWKVKNINEENVFDYAVSLIGDDASKIEIVLVYDRWVICKDIGITCDNRLDGYRTHVKKVTERYAVCQLLGVGSPAVVRLEVS